MSDPVEELDDFKFDIKADSSDKQLDEIQKTANTTRKTVFETIQNREDSELLKPACTPAKLGLDCTTCAQLRQDIHQLRMQGIKARDDQNKLRTQHTKVK